jgi:uncharacterized protein YbaP (TraB family)
MKTMASFLLLVWSVFVSALLQASAPTPQPELDEVLVTGEQPGPGLWRVTANGNELWILGTLDPLPAKMRWRSNQADSIIARSRQVLAPPGVSIDIGFFKSLTLLPTLLRARKMADGRTLEQALASDTYARWRVLKARYLPNADGVEKHRPIVAAQELYRSALAHSGLESNDDIWEQVRQSARRHEVPVTPVTVSPTIEDPKGTLQELQQIELAQEVSCLVTTMQRLETDLPLMRLRANHWSRGDIDALRAMPHVDQRTACFDAVASVPALRERLLKTRQRLEELWVAAAQVALTNSRCTFAVLPIGDLLRSDGLLSRLKARGYEVQEPR